MGDSEDRAAAMVEHRRKRDKILKSLGHMLDRIKTLQGAEEFASVTYTNIKDRISEFNTLYRRLTKHIDALEDEEDEDLSDADEVIKGDLSRTYDQATRLLSYLSAVKRVGSLLCKLENLVVDLEELRAEDTGKDITACYGPIERILDQIYVETEVGNVEVEHEVSQQTRLLSKRFSRVKTNTESDAKPTLYDSFASRNIDAPKVNLPEFHGDLMSWPIFWSRYNASVHESTKLTDSMKMAVLMDRIKDSGISRYLVAANDGRPGRYGEVIKYLKDRFNRPRELHQVYLNQLIGLTTIDGSSAEISKAVDIVFSAVTGIKGSGQDTIEYIATSLVANILPENMRQEWENKSEDMEGVPPIEAWISFMRKKATKVSLNPRVAYQESVPSKYPKDKRRKPKEAKVYTNQGDSAAKGEHDSGSNKSTRLLGMENLIVHCVIMATMYFNVNNS